MIQQNYQQLMHEGSLNLQKLGFNGNIYRTSNFWYEHIPKDLFNKPINYLEIGAYYGANAVSMTYSYCKHPESKIYCIDPWSDYEGLAEKEHADTSIYSKFIYNISRTNELHKFVIKQNTSSNILPELENNFFDIIYIDGNHEPEYVLEDAVLCFRKLKVNGYLIFDDYAWGDVNTGIDAFVSCYKKYIKVISIQNCQMFIQKIEKY